MSIRKQATTGILWTSFGQTAQQVIQFGSGILLARLLAPSDFGLVAMSTVAVGFLTLFKDLGTSAAIIQHPNPSERLLSTIFWTNVAIGALGTCIVYGAAPYVAALYHEPKVVPLLRTLSLTFALSGLTLLHSALFERSLDFRTPVQIEAAATVVGSALAIGAALNGFGVWSLVLRAVTMAAATTAMLWVVSGYRPRAMFSWSDLMSVSKYSLNLTGFTVVNYFARNADTVLIGRVLGSTYVGVYNLAYQIMLYPLQNISYVIARVMFPVYSRMREDDERVRNTYVRVAAAIAFVSFPMMLGLFGLAGPFVITVLGQKWQSTTILLRILAPVGMVQSVVTMVGGLYQAKGRTDWFLAYGVVSTAVAVSGIVIGLQWGTVGVAGGYAIANAILLYPALAIPFRLIDLPVSRFIAALMRPLSCGLVMLGFILAFRLAAVSRLGPAEILFIGIPAGAVIYFIASLCLNRETVCNVAAALGLKGRVLSQLQTLGA
jgi:PST family polysaccharide transporter